MDWGGRNIQDYLVATPVTGSNIFLQFSYEECFVPLKKFLSSYPNALQQYYLLILGYLSQVNLNRQKE